MTPAPSSSAVPPSSAPAWATLEALADDAGATSLRDRFAHDPDRAARLSGAVGDRIRAGTRTGATGAPIRAVVNLGIGGSHLGPAMAHEALGHLAHPDVEVRFTASLDGAAIGDALAGLDPAATLVVACSKSFTTPETMVALDTATDWLRAGVGNDLSRHVAAVTAVPSLAESRGIDPDLVLALPDTVGGRFSLASAAGLALMAAIGPDAFADLLAGGEVRDEPAAPLVRRYRELRGG